MLAGGDTSAPGDVAAAISIDPITGAATMQIMRAAHSHYDVIVLGLGVMGLSACWRMAKAGSKVLGLEQFGFGHAHGSSHGATRVIRKAYFEHPDYVPLLHRAYDGWRELEQESGIELLNLCGVLSIGAPQSELITGVRRSCAEHQLIVKELSPAEISKRFPGISVPSGGDYVGLLEHAAGFVRADRALQALQHSAQQHGADLRDNTPVTGWRASGDHMTVQTAAGEFTAKHLVITAGAWAVETLRELGVTLQPRRMFAYWYPPAAPAIASPDRLPCCIAETPAGQYYFLPEDKGFSEQGIKVGRHDESPELQRLRSIAGDPRVIGNAEELEQLERRDVQGFVEAFLSPAVGNATPRDVTPCLYTMSPDSHFIIDRHPRHPNASFAAGFSGHGFKFGPVVGEILNGIATEGDVMREANFLRLNRFS